MGHRFSKAAANSSADATATISTCPSSFVATAVASTNSKRSRTQTTAQLKQTQTKPIPITEGHYHQYQQELPRTAVPTAAATINLQIQESPCSILGPVAATTTATCEAHTAGDLLRNIDSSSCSSYSATVPNSSSLTSVNSLTCAGRQIIIKIQLAKMENGNESHEEQQQQQQDTVINPTVSLETLTTDCNVNSRELLMVTPSATVNSTNQTGNAQILNLTLNGNNANVTAGSSLQNINNNYTSTSSSTSSSLSSATAAIIPPSVPSSSALTMVMSNSGNAEPQQLGNVVDLINNSSVSSATTATSLENSLTNKTANLLSERRLERRFNALQFNDEIVEQNIGEIVEYCEVLEAENQTTAAAEQEQQQQLHAIKGSLPSNNMGNILRKPEADASTTVDTCCSRRKSKNNSSNIATTSSSSATAKTRRCRKCSCRDAFRRILDPSSSRENKAAAKQLQQQQQQQQQLLEQHTNVHISENRHSIPLIRSNEAAATKNSNKHQRNSLHSSLMRTAAGAGPSATTLILSGGGGGANGAGASTNATTTTVWTTTTTTGTTNGNGDVIIPLPSSSSNAGSQFVVVQCAIVNSAAPVSSTSSAASSNPARASMPNSILRISSGVPSSSSTRSPNRNHTRKSFSPTSSNSNNTSSPLASSNNRQVSAQSMAVSTPAAAAASVIGPIVHSHVDFVHHLVPDLERITNSTYYWGKMDRYEAERLLEGKAEGTFLLRDSAQEEFLFSVTFRKYGRSLHARIEQSGHRFSFDCHDPCVFTAPTVTGLLEHYKDPACVMFFEPMLTIPLHRKNCFSLQQLSRATIVSNSTYDGINELELPTRLKSYLKEYHYKQKLRVKLNEPTYTIHCK